MKNGIKFKPPAGGNLGRMLLWGWVATLNLLVPSTFAAEVTNGSAKLTRIACVGDSITFGAGVSDRETKTYPILLQNWLGAQWEVGNFGASGSTLLTKGNLPYIKRPHFRKALEFKPDVALIMLGTNDSKRGSADNSKIADNWQYKSDFVADYKALLSEFRKANPKLKIYLGLPVPVFAPNRYGIDGRVIEQEIVPLVRQIAAEEKAEVIDLHTSLVGKPEMFHDRVHPNDAGTRVMAATVYQALTGKEAPKEAVFNKLEAAASAVVSTPVADSTVSRLAQEGVTSPTTATTIAPFAAGITPPKKENFHLYLLMGQSNMVGRDIRDLANPNSPHLLSLNSEGQWVIAKDPLHFQEGRIAPGVGPGISFAQEMLKANPNVTIGLIPCAVGGTSLGRWAKGGTLYDNAVKRAKIASQTGTVKGVLWHQGESDTTYPKKAETYGKTLAGMFKSLRADLGQNDLPIVVGQLGEFLTTEKYPYVEGVRSALSATPASVPNTGLADSKGLGHKGDGLHFSAEAEKQMGVRFAQEMQQLQK